MLFYKVLMLFRGCTRTCSHSQWLENRIIFHIIYIITILSPQPDTNDSIGSGFDEGPPSEKRNVLWLVSCPSALWLAKSLDAVTKTPPLPKQNGKFVNIVINSDQ